MTRFERSATPGIYAAIALSAAAVFIADRLVPLGIVIWIFYLVPVALCLRVPRHNLPIFVASACTAALIVELVRSSESLLPRDATQVNRTLGFIVIWSVAIMTRRVVLARLVEQRQQWLRAGQHMLSDRVQGDVRIEPLAARILEFLAPYLDAQVAAMYVVDGRQLRRVAGFALERSEDLPSVFALGERLVGQAATQRKVVRVREVPAGYLTVGSGLGAAAPRELLLAPVFADGTVNGVMELGFFRHAHDSDVELLDLVAERIGIALQSSQNRSQLEDLLDRTQRQASELQAQQEELRVSNEELEEQSRALRESQARLELQQAELEQANSHLEEQSELLARQKSQLQAAQVVLSERGAELERESRYKSEFLANMSHELRTPLNSSLILAKLLSDNRDGNLTPEQVQFAQSIYAAGNDLLDLINDILDLSKIESGMMEVHAERVRLAQVVETLASTFQPIAEQKGLRFSAVVEGDAPASIETDVQRLLQILKNLLSNALKFTERGDVALRISADGAERIRLAVRDTGIGIPSTQQEAIFQAFMQANGATNRKYGGTGLGLSISRDLARLLGGEIELQSEPGQGSTFTVLLPVTYRRAEGTTTALAPSRPAGPPAPPVAAVPAPRRRAARLSGIDDDRTSLDAGSRVLLVIEDDEAFARILYDLAHELGFRCLVAAGGDEGVELAVQFRPAAIVLDMNLPDHSGLTVLDRLKRDPATRHIPVQVASVEDWTQAALEMGAAGYMLKPVRREQLVEALSKLEARFSQGLRSVLVVEDDPVQRESICHLLDTEDVRTVPVDTAAAALEQLRTSTYDCMVLDMSLPDASGFELLEKMAMEDQYSFPPVIVYTGRSLSSDEEQRLRRYSKSIIIKGARSPERLLDEVTLFLHQVEANLPADRRRMLQEARSRDALFEGRTILVVEDDVRNIFALSSVLEPRGATLRIARNGREALDALDAGPRVDMVLMDIMMPEMDGYEAMREIRKRPEMTSLPIIALTARAMRDDQERCLAAGASDYIAKPIDVEQLLSLMRVWMPR